jgi:hypothetical protein
MADSAAATIWEGVFEATLLLLLPQPAAMTAIVAAAAATPAHLVCSDMAIASGADGPAVPRTITADGGSLR